MNKGVIKRYQLIIVKLITWRPALLELLSLKFFVDFNLKFLPKATSLQNLSSQNDFQHLNFYHPFQ